MGQMPRGQGTEQRRNPASGCSAPRPTGPANSQEPSVGFRVNKRRGAAHGKGTWLFCPILGGGFGHGKKGSATRGGANPSGSLEKRGKNRVLSAGGSGEALRQRGRERRGGRQAEEMKAAILSCLWLAAWNTPPWRLLPQISLFFCTGKEATSSVPLEGSERRWVCLCLVGFCFFFPTKGVQITMFSACCVHNSWFEDAFGRFGDFCFPGGTSGLGIWFLVSFPPP